MKRIDSHTHVDLFNHDSSLIELIKAHEIAIATQAFSEQYDTNGFPNPAEFLRYLESQRQACEEYKQRYGLIIYRMIGVHPKNASAALMGHNVISDTLDSVLSDATDDIVGIGEIGLDDDTEDERSAFVTQLNYAAEHNLPVSIHTPKNTTTQPSKKKNIFREILGILPFTRIMYEHILIDHVHDDKTTNDSQEGSMLQRVLIRGYYAGITVAAGKTSPIQALSMVRNHLRRQEADYERIIMNSDVLQTSAGSYVLYAGLGDLFRAEFGDKIANALLYENARIFFKIQKDGKLEEPISSQDPHKHIKTYQ